jgi:hypothetical protein
MKRVVVQPNGCWEWTGAHNQGGYATFCQNRKKVLAHRVAYEHWIGPIPEGRVLDHLCRNRGCVNPHCTEAVTDKVNILRGEGAAAKLARRIHCENGHAFTKESTLLASSRRTCRICRREYMKNRRKATKATIQRIATGARVEWKANPGKGGKNTILQKTGIVLAFASAHTPITSIPGFETLSRWDFASGGIVSIHDRYIVKVDNANLFHTPLANMLEQQNRITREKASKA